MSLFESYPRSYSGAEGRFAHLPQSVIHNVRLSGYWPDVLATRLRLEAFMQSASLSIPGFPPTALLVVKHLQDRQISHWISTGITNFSAGINQWEQTISSCLASLARQAGRPALGPVPPDAPAVLFLDLTELYSCLALDLVKSEAPLHWWWQVTFPSRNYAHELVHDLIRAPQLIPAIFEGLALQRQSAAFARSLGETASQDLVRAVLQAFQLDGLEKLLEQEVLAARLPASGEDLPGPNAGQIVGAGLRPAPTGPAPTNQVTLETLYQLVPECQEAGLMEAGAPARRFLLALSLAVRRFPTALRKFTGPPSAAGLGLSERGEGTIESLPGLPDQAGIESRLPPFLVNAPPTPEGLPVARPEFPYLTDPPPAERESILPSAEQRPEQIPFARTAAPIPTRFGGLFYLLNLALYLGIYNDFTQPANPGWAISPWDLLALLGKVWLGPELQEDPLWDLLARLANRPPEQDPPMDFIPPQDWQEMLTGSPVMGIQADWLENLAVLLQTRLAETFGQDQHICLLRQEAQIWVSAVRLDIHYALASHPIEIRLAGLDRDLGWLPAAGMYIYYHYEL